MSFRQSYFYIQANVVQKEVGYVHFGLLGLFMSMTAVMRNSELCKGRQLVKTIDNTLNPVEKVSAWLYRVARNTIINKWKKKYEYELPLLYDKDDNV